MRRRWPLPFPASVIVALWLFAVVLATAGCGGKDDGPPGPAIVRPAPAGAPRALRLGLGAVPPVQSDAAYRQAFATAAQYGDVVLIQRAPPWKEFMPGGQVSDATAALTQLERDLVAQYAPLKLFFAIDPTDPAAGRSRIIDPPNGIAHEQGFRNVQLRDAFKAYTAYVVENYKPAYLALGVEINMLYESSRDQFEAFVSLYREAYDQAKQLSPGTLVFPTIQLEDLEGKLAEPHSPSWQVVEAFRDKMDALAISTYPHLGTAESAADIPAGYYRQIRTAANWKGRVIIAEAGYASEPIEGRATVGTEEDQAAFLARLLEAAQAEAFTLVVWALPLDPGFAQAGPAAVFRHTGLRKADGANKLAWTIWEEWARRPLAGD